MKEEYSSAYNCTTGGRKAFFLKAKYLILVCSRNALLKHTFHFVSKNITKRTANQNSHEIPLHTQLW
jgi:hypothetical protein